MAYALGQRKCTRRVPYCTRKVKDRAHVAGSITGSRPGQYRDGCRASDHIRYGSIALLYSHRAGISRLFGLFSIGTLGKGGGSKCGVRVGGLRLGLRVGVYTVTVTVSLGYFSI